MREHEYLPKKYAKQGYIRLPRDHPNAIECAECGDKATMKAGAEYVCLSCETVQMQGGGE